jgi:hypothetical protein
MGKKIEVDDRLLKAADRMYDAIDTALNALDHTRVIPELLAGLRYQLQRAKDGYDAAMSLEDPS